MITGFTLGHSITLALAALGWVIPDLDIVEAAIGFTIALVAAQNIAVLTGNHRQITYFSVAALLLIVLINLTWNIGLSVLSGLDWRYLRSPIYGILPTSKSQLTCAW